jgi:hypothetical protein
MKRNKAADPKKITSTGGLLMKNNESVNQPIQNKYTK